MGTLVTMCTGVAALFLTFSRSAWVVFILLMLFIFGGRIRRLPIFVQIVPVAVSLVIGLFVVSTFSTKTESVDMRVSLATAAVRQFQSSPIVGVGLGTFTYHLPSMTTLRSMTFLQPVHSIYMLHVSETGIIGVLVFILWMIFLGNMYIDFRDKKKLHDAKPWMLACIAVLLLGMIDHYPTTLQQGRLLFALLVGCLFLAHDGRVHS